MPTYKVHISHNTGVPPGYEYEDQCQVLETELTVEALSQHLAEMFAVILYEEDGFGIGDCWVDCDDSETCWDWVDEYDIGSWEVAA